MGLLNDIFSKVVFSEIEPLFDEMEKAFLLLMRGYELNMPEETPDNGLYHQMELLLNNQVTQELIWENGILIRSLIHIHRGRIFLL